MFWAGRPLHCPVENSWQWRGCAALDTYLLWWVGSARAEDIRDAPSLALLTATSSHLCALPCWRDLEDSSELYQGHPSKPHVLLYQSFISLSVKLLSHGKPVIKGSLMPILLTENCSVYISLSLLGNLQDLQAAQTAYPICRMMHSGRKMGQKCPSKLISHVLLLVLGLVLNAFFVFLNKHIYHSKTFYLIFLKCSTQNRKKEKYL